MNTCKKNFYNRDGIFKHSSELKRVQKRVQTIEEKLKNAKDTLVAEVKRHRYSNNKAIKTFARGYCIPRKDG